MASLIDQWVERLLLNPSAGAENTSPLGPISQEVRKIKGKLTRDQVGLGFVRSDAFDNALATLDEAGLTGLADELYADALLIHPNARHKNDLGQRLLSRGRTQEAQGIFAQLTTDTHFAHNAFKKLARIAERTNKSLLASRYLECALAWDFQDPEIHARLNRLSQGLGRKRRSNYLLTSLVRGAKVVGEGFQLRKHLGRGGAATVYHALVTGTQQEVAIKVFHRSSDSKRFQQKALGEARFTAQISHPHVVSIFDVNPEKGFLVMAFCSGGSLRDKLKQKKPSLDETIDMAIVLLRTLADIHERGFAHLDIKPSNILFEHHLPYFSDFGVALKRHEKIPTGTQAYMAPEQKLGEVDQASDVFAMGLVLTECILGHRPKNGTRALHLPNLPKGPKRWALESMLQNMSAKRPDERPKNLRRQAEAFLWAQALPDSEAQGQILLKQMRKWAEKQGPHALESLQKHPIIAYLSPVDLKEKSSAREIEE